MKKVKKLTKILISLTENKSPEEKEAIIRSFLTLLLQKKKIHLARQILREVKREKAKKEVILCLARKIDKNLLKETKEKLADFFGKEKEFKIKIQEELIAGFLAKSQNYLIDASIRGLLRKFRNWWGKV